MSKHYLEIQPTGYVQARNQDFMWGGANEAKVDQTTEMYFLLSDPFINIAELLRKYTSAFHRILS